VPTLSNQLQQDNMFTYSYDAEGNLLSKVNKSTGETTTYSYDNVNHLLSVVDTMAGLEIDYKYDALGQRIERQQVAGGTGNPDERYGYDRVNVWVDLDSGNNPLARRFYLDGVDQVFARIAYAGGVGALGYYLTDRQGSVRRLIDTTGTVVNTVTYADAYGASPTDSVAALGDRYKYTGREYDKDTGLQYNRGRYYDPRTERWTSQDPLGADGSDPNLYRYVQNHPTNATDPSGLLGFSTSGVWRQLEESYKGKWYRLRGAGWSLVSKGGSDTGIPDEIISSFEPDTSISVDVYESTFEKLKAEGANVDYINDEWAIDFDNRLIWIDAYKNDSAAKYFRKVVDRIEDLSKKNPDLILSGIANLDRGIDQRLVPGVGGQVDRWQSGAAAAEVVKRGGLEVSTQLGISLATGPVLKFLGSAGYNLISSGGKFLLKKVTARGGKQVLTSLTKGTLEWTKGLLGRKTGLKVVDGLRRSLKIAPDRNIAFAEIAIKGKPNEVAFAVSSQVTPKGTVGVPTKRVFNPLPTGGTLPTDNHSEVKLLEDIAKNLTKDSKGEIYIFTERYPCQSCTDIITRQWGKKFPGVKIVLEHGNRGRIWNGPWPHD
jgi:RHS repeat-associated protein